MNYTIAGGAAGAPALRLGEPAEYAGRWIVTRDGGPPCAVRLAAGRVEEANAHAFADEVPACLAELLGARPAGWRPAPDGIDFAAPDGLSLAFFAREEEARWSARRPDGSVLHLVRAPG